MRLCSAFLAAVLLLQCPPAIAQDATLAAAAALIRATDADIQKQGPKGIAGHVPDLEKALADGAAYFPAKPGPDGKLLLLVDGPVETVMAMAQAGNAVAVANPFAEIGTILAFHYNEVRNPQDALRVIEATLRLEAVPGAHLGGHAPQLFTEQGAAYNLLKNWDAALASAEAVLKVARNDRDKARGHRGRGFAMIELQRLAEAQAEYEESLRLEPGNQIALRELAYIRRIRAGGPRAAPDIVAPGTAPAAPEPAPPKEAPI